MSFSRRIYFLAAFAYLLFVVYGSLVPFDFQPRTFDSALKSFMHIPYLSLGMDSRADWVANILLYIPLSFLWLGTISREGHSLLRAFWAIFVFLLCVLLSIGIEFTQQFFPPRTVSLNDILAEIAGALVGIALWCIIGEKLRRLLEILFAQGKNAAYAGLTLYTIGYLAFSLFPYDFLISADEIRTKLAGQFFHWLPPQSACGGALRCGAKLIAEGAAIAPLGLLIGLAATKDRASLIRSAAWKGGWLGLLIEALQIFLFSGISLWISVLTRASGVAAGAFVGQMLKRSSIWPLLYFLSPFIPIATIGYGLVLVIVAWLGKGPLLTMNQGLGRLAEIRFMPFYYHYYTSESAAMTSFFAVAIMFLPIGIQYWVWRVTHLREFVLRGALKAAAIGCAIAATVEIGKLFFANARPDPTNLLIGSLSAAAGFIAASVCTRGSLTVDLLDVDASTHPSN